MELYIAKEDQLLSGLEVMRCIYADVSGRQGFDINDKSLSLSKRYLANSYIWDFKHKRLMDFRSYGDVENTDYFNFFVFMRRFGSDDHPERKIHYHRSKNLNSFNEINYEVLPFLDFSSRSTNDDYRTILSFLDVFDWITIWDNQMNMNVFSRNSSIVFDFIEECAKDNDVILNEVLMSDIPMW